jgi:hypothetical protein
LGAADILLGATCSQDAVLGCPYVAYLGGDFSPVSLLSSLDVRSDVVSERSDLSANGDRGVGIEDLRDDDHSSRARGRVVL